MATHHPKQQPGSSAQLDPRQEPSTPSFSAVIVKLEDVKKAEGIAKALSKSLSETVWNKAGIRPAARDDKDMKVAEEVELEIALQNAIERYGTDENGRKADGVVINAVTPEGDVLGALIADKIDGLQQYDPQAQLDDNKLDDEKPRLPPAPSNEEYVSHLKEVYKWGHTTSIDKYLQKKLHAVKQIHAEKGSGRGYWCQL
ncbi:Uu.00g010130.m01.CDS01 [Anthostomella pinea]|uniref:Uu.00g010130.m01.CDS01 n=1 Tax=Anthostomella pinea TaxID=933095 RepID=A0AAI8VXH0_9PEZI|nr:Uu.00g010130.m01.CDS01 [Anthostomella pinea]